MKLDDEKAGQVARSNDSNGKRDGATPVTMVEAQFSLKVPSDMTNCKRVQFPLALAWACTVHKVQGLTLSKVAACLQLYKQNSFNARQLLVGLRRATSLSSLSIVGDIHSDYI